MPLTLTQWNRASGLPSLEARVLLGHVLQVTSAWVVAHDEAVLDEMSRHHLDALADRRRQGEPLAYLVGEKEFWGMMFKVTPDVLIPRPDTETLVETALRYVPVEISTEQKTRVLDLGTGSGAVAIAIARERPYAWLCATDISEAALRVAEENATRLLQQGAARILCCLSDWFSAIPIPRQDSERFSVIVSNPPYVAAADTHLDEGDVRFEPRGALVGGVSGWEALQVIAQQASAYLRPGGVLLMEHGYDQSDVTKALLRDAGLIQCETVYDLAGVPRVTLGRL
ncbi:MAG: peptide chain release factor N(5)-glutamine methyltransferase [Burkholderiales bacterium]|jgi:release factor glutamine methyltransferase|nr:peptide chain release factor N(5)-glutamine methyltransferase [Burkholderiales bacterium]